MADASPVPRRGVLALGTLGVGALLSGCGLLNYERCDTRTAGRSAVRGRQELAKLADITVGEAIMAKKAGCESIIVARPNETTAVAFSAICPHKGAIVTPEGGRLRCPAHDALFDAATGAVTRGPAARPLTSIAVSVINGAVTTT